MFIVNLARKSEVYCKKQGGSWLCPRLYIKVVIRIYFITYSKINLKQATRFEYINNIFARKIYFTYT